MENTVKTELTIEQIEKASVKELLELSNYYINYAQNHFAKLVKNVANEKTIAELGTVWDVNELLKQKHLIKKLSALNGDFKTFSTISQDIREMERNG
jgi:hypothetical protein